MYKRPVIIFNHPKEVKPFYVRLNDDKQTVASFDMVVPKVTVNCFLLTNHQWPIKIGNKLDLKYLLVGWNLNFR